MPIDASTVLALVPALSGSASNASTTPNSTAPTTPTSETSGIDFSSDAKGKMYGFKTRLVKFKTSTKSFLRKTNKRLKPQSNPKPFIVTVEASGGLGERVSVMQVAARFQDLDDASDGMPDIPMPVLPSQVSLIPLHDGSFPASPASSGHTNAEILHDNSWDVDDIDRHSSHSQLVVITQTEELSAMTVAFLRCFAAWWPSILGCIVMCLAATAAYDVYWASTLPIFCLVHPDSPVWSKLAACYVGREAPKHPHIHGK